MTACILKGLGRRHSPGDKENYPKRRAPQPWAAGSRKLIILLQMGELGKKSLPFRSPAEAFCSLEPIWKPKVKKVHGSMLVEGQNITGTGDPWKGE